MTITIREDYKEDVAQDNVIDEMLIISLNLL